MEPIYIALGTHCQTAHFLKEFGYRTAAYPFDWVFSALPMIAHIIETRFVWFLDRRLFRPQRQAPLDEEAEAIEDLVEDLVADVAGPGLADHCCGHRLYGDIFNHRNPRRGEDLAYYQRCVIRFYEALRSPRPKVFLHVRPNQTRALTHDELRQIVDLKHLLDHHCIGPARLIVIQCCLLDIRPMIYGLPFEIALAYIPTSWSDGLNFADQDSWVCFYRTFRQCCAASAP